MSERYSKYYDRFDARYTEGAGYYARFYAV